MGSMSASDAAPLPRLGEVFFDVRGNSRSMRLSWYADTGVAVFSIWQGGTCTGTFRLPMDDLARMIESLRRGPQGQRAGAGRYRARRAVKTPAARPGGPAGRGPERARPPWPCGCLPGPARRRASARTGRAWRAAPGAGIPGRGARRLRDGPGPGPTRASPAATRLTRSTRPTRSRRPGIRRSRPPGRTAARPRSTARARGIPPSPGYQDGPATGDYRRAGGGGLPRICLPPATTAAASPAATAVSRATFPASPARSRYAAEPGRSGVPRGGPPRRDTATPATRTCRAPATTAPSSPGATAGRAGGYPDDPSFHPYSGQPGIADYPGEAPADDSGAYPAGPDYGEGAEWEDTADHSLEDYGSEPEESFPYGPPPGNHDRRERGRYPGRH